MTMPLVASGLLVALADASNDPDNGDQAFAEYIAGQGFSGSVLEIASAVDEYKRTQLAFWDGIYRLQTGPSSISLTIFGGVPYVNGKQASSVSYSDAQLALECAAGELDLTFSFDDEPRDGALFAKRCAGTFKSAAASGLLTAGETNSVATAYIYSSDAQINSYDGNYTVLVWSAETGMYSQGPSFSLSTSDSGSNLTYGAIVATIDDTWMVTNSAGTVQLVGDAANLGVDITFSNLPTSPPTPVFSGNLWYLPGDKPLAPNVQGQIVASSSSDWDGYGTSSFIVSVLSLIVGGLALAATVYLAVKAPLFAKQFEAQEKLRQHDLDEKTALELRDQIGKTQELLQTEIAKYGKISKKYGVAVNQVELAEMATKFENVRALMQKTIDALQSRLEEIEQFRTRSAEVLARKRQLAEEAQQKLDSLSEKTEHTEWEKANKALEQAKNDYREAQQADEQLIEERESTKSAKDAYERMREKAKA